MLIVSQGLRESPPVGLLAGVADGEAGAAHRMRLFTGVVAALREAAETAPLALVLDDVHWADGSTLDLVGYLVHSLDEAPVLVVVSRQASPGHRLHPQWTVPIDRG